MPKVESLPFVSYTFTDEELAIAGAFSPEQTMFLETELSRAAMARVAVAYDPSIPNSAHKYIYEQEYYRGQIELLQYLLEGSRNLNAAKQSVLLRQAESQNFDEV